MSFPELVTPETVAEAVGLLSDPQQKTLIFGGGTLVQPLITLGTDAFDVVIDLDELALNQIIVENERVSCGAMVRLAQLGQLPHDCIREAVASIAGPAVRNLATIGGNIFAKSPYGDLATLLLALDAEVEIAGRDETLWSSLNEFYLSRDNPKAPSTKAVLVTRIRFDVDPRKKIIFHKMARRLLNSGAIVTVALSLRLDSEIVREVRVALGGVGPRPVRALSTERILTGSRLDLEVIETAAQAALQDCDPQTDAYASAWYRRRMVPLQIRRALTSLH
jgi:CO/xanthine dehydrogenase FAD-binding subunit